MKKLVKWCTEEKTYLFVDISDLRFRIMVKGGFSVTIREDHCKEVKIIRSVLEKEGFEIKNIWDFSEKEVFDALDHLASKLLEIYSKEQIFFLYTVPTPLFVNKCGEFIDDDEVMHQKYWNCRPDELTKYNNYFIHITNCNVIKFPWKAGLVSDTNHMFGLFPLHYIDDVYRYYYWELIRKIEDESLNSNKLILCKIEKYIDEARNRNAYSDKLPDKLIKAISRDDFCGYVNGLAKAYSSLIVICVKDTIGYCVSQAMSKALHSLGLCADFQKLHQKGYIAIISNGVVVDEIIGTEECRAVSDHGMFYGNTLEVESKPFHDGNFASIVWNGHDVAINKRGLNFFVYDYHTDRICDIRCYDTHLKECVLTKNNDFLDKETAVLISMEKILNLLSTR